MNLKFLETVIVSIMITGAPAISEGVQTQEIKFCHKPVIIVISIWFR